MNPRILEWVFDNLGLVIVLAITAFSFLRGLLQAGKGEDESSRGRPSPASLEDPEEAERTRRIQEEIRRKIMERRAAAEEREQPPPLVVTSDPVRERIPPLVRPQNVPPVDPFGGPMRKIIRKLEEAAEARGLEPADDSATRAVLERQRKLEEEMRALEAARAAERQRAAALAAARREGGEKREAAAMPMRGGLREELRDPRALRRAFVLREVLGAPVSLR